MTWILGLAVLGGCADADAGPRPGGVADRPTSVASGLGTAFGVLAAHAEAPSVAEVERALGVAATVVPRQDRHEEVRFPGGMRFLRLVPAPPDGRARLDTGAMAALTVPAASLGEGCLSPDTVRSRLIREGWLAPQAFSMERHDAGDVRFAAPWTLSRHDHRLHVQLFADHADCLSRYVLSWNMDLSILMHLMPE
ncbi:MAG: hypothetical protein ACT6RD_06160 [Brevundimonas sp.]|uniref:hypothetical protein n=1 Tax=Brevundimonas sp. TaxID=1871086 RepID=UPI0040333879